MEEHCNICSSFSVLKTETQMKIISFRNDVLPMKDKLFRLALRITLNRQDAEDVVQEVLIKIWNNRERWQQLESIEAWAFTITRNMSLDVLRKNEAHRTVEIDTEPLASNYDQFNERERLQLVRKLMDSLPEKQRTAMQLRDFEGMSYKEVADIMGISEEQVKVNIYRARQFIKQKYSEISEYGL